MGTTVRTEIDGNIVTLWLDGQARRNALASTTWAAIPEAVAEADGTSGCRAIILRGSGSHFGAGADIKEFGKVFANRTTTLAYFGQMEAAMQAIESASRPTVAVIEGLCVGACVALALACDIRLASPGSSYAITPAKLGIAYPYGDIARVASTIGISRAKALMFSGRPIDADIALTYGLVDTIIDGEFETGVADYLGSIVACSPFIVRTTKRALHALQSGSSQAAADYPGILADAVSGADFTEGMAAFAARRPPCFTG